MHLLSGLLLSELFLSRRLLTRARGPAVALELVHVLPGRLRARLPLLRGDRELAAQVEARVAELEGVHAVVADPRSGSVLVHFADGLEVRRELVQTLRELVRQRQAAEASAAPPADQQGEPSLRLQLKQAGREADQQMMRQTSGTLDLGTLLAVAAGGWGFKTMVAPGVLSRWQGLTLLYWSYNMLKH